MHAISSDHQPGEQELFVMLPDHFDPTKTYRVLYVLPVALGRVKDGKLPWGNVVKQLEQIDPANKYNIIVCRPSFAADPWFSDPKQIAYLREVVVPTMEKRYRTPGTPEGRLLMGFSKSGSGAFKIILENADFFGYAASWDGNMYPEHLQNIISRTPEKLAPFKERNRLVLCGGKNNHWERNVVEYHEMLQKAGVLHTYDDTQHNHHSWDAKWMAPTIEALMKLCQVDKAK
jgi:enterochelin esterase-like enzyme